MTKRFLLPAAAVVLLLATWTAIEYASTDWQPRVPVGATIKGEWNDVDDKYVEHTTTHYKENKVLKVKHSVIWDLSKTTLTGMVVIDGKPRRIHKRVIGQSFESPYDPAHPEVFTYRVSAVYKQKHTWFFDIPYYDWTGDAEISMRPL